MRDKLNFQMRWKFRIEKAHLLNKLALAGAGGIEPPNGGIKISLIVQQFQDAFGKKTSKAV